MEVIINYNGKVDKVDIDTKKLKIENDSGFYETQILILIVA